MATNISSPFGSEVSRDIGRRRTLERIATGGVGVAALITISLLAIILGYIIYKGAAAINWNLLTSTPAPAGEKGGGVGNAIVGSFIIVGLATLIAIPVGIGAAVFVVEFPTRWLGRAVRFMADMLVSVPSIVVGIFVYTLIVAPMGHFSGFSGSIAYVVIMVPIILVASQEALKLVPDSLREAAFALGSSQWRMIWSVALPVASRALITGAIIAVARALGETAPLLFTSLGNQFYQLSPNQPMAALPLVIYRLAIGPYDDWHDQAWAAAFLLVVIVLAGSILTRLIIRKNPGGS